MTKTLATAAIIALFAIPATAEQGAIGAAASFHGQALGKGWGQAVSERSKATNSGMAGGEEPAGPGHTGSTDPGVGNTGGGNNNGKEG